MPFEPTVDSLESVQEDARPFYVKDEKSGKFNLITADNVTKLENSLKGVRTELMTAKDRAKAVEGWEKLGKTQEEIEKLLADHADAETKKALEAGEFEKLKKQIEDNHGNVLKERDAREGKLKTALERHLIDAQATAALAEAKGAPALLLPHIRDRVRVEEKDDDFIVTVLDTDKKTPKLNAKNEPMTIKELVESMREDETFGRAFEGSGHSGGGGGGGGNPPPAGGKKKADMTAKEKAAYMREHGHAAYGQLA